MITYRPDHRISGRLLLVGLAMLIGGCGINKPFPEKGLYSINAGQPDQSRAATRPSAGASYTVLQVPQMRIATPYDGNSFVYRVGPEKYTSDYYNGFIASPAALLTGQLIDHLSSCGLYNSVVDGNSSVDYHLILEGNITELCGDYTKPKSPQGVIAIRFFVLRQSSDGIHVLHEKVYRVAQPASNGKPEALVEAWGSAYRQIMQDLTADLRTIDAAPSSPVQANAR